MRYGSTVDNECLLRVRACAIEKVFSCNDTYSIQYASKIMKVSLRGGGSKIIFFSVLLLSDIY